MLDYYALMSNFSQQPKPRLLDQVRNVLRLKHYSYRTKEAYVQWIKKLSSLKEKLVIAKNYLSC